MKATLTKPVVGVQLDSRIEETLPSGEDSGEAERHCILG